MDPRVTAEQLAEFKAAFETFEPSHSVDGSIPEAQVGTVLRSVDMLTGEEELRMILSSLPVANDGSRGMGFKDFVRILCRRLSDTGINTEGIREEISAHDAMGSGHIQMSQLSDILRRQLVLTAEEIAELFALLGASVPQDMDLVAYEPLLKLLDEA